MKLMQLPQLSMSYPKTTLMAALLVTILFGWQFTKINIDTDPENMLEPTQPDRVFFDAVKEDFGIHDLIVLGIEDPQGIFRPDTLQKVFAITDEILTIPGVIYNDVVSLMTTDDVSFDEGFLRVRPVMESIPSDDKSALALKETVLSNPLFSEKLASRDGMSTAIYVPIEAKKESYRIAQQIEQIAEKHLEERHRHYLAGLPVAEDTFGYAMFRQMAMTAPLAGMVIFLLMYFFFRQLILVIAPMAVAMMSIIWAMGLLIGMGFTVHIMSSMIPVFLMPIAVLDGVHILSEFFDRSHHFKNPKKAMEACMEELYTPMFYTSLTSALGFTSLVLAPIPPVQVFGVFIAFGILAAWILSITLIPASIMLISQERLPKVGAKSYQEGLLVSALTKMEDWSSQHARWISIGGATALAIGVIGVAQLQVNDNPVKWFKKNHPIRVADRFMNQAFGGTYMAYLVAKGSQPNDMKRPEVLSYLNQLQGHLEMGPIVGKSTSIADMIKRVNFVLQEEQPDAFVIPNSQDAIAQELFLLLSSGDPDDLDNFVDYDYQKANLWIQMKSGDNTSMEKVEDDLSSFIQANPLPHGVTLTWSGLTYINKVWQDLMVVGMMKAVLGSFVAVFLLMTILFRSVPLGFISMIPLTFAIVLSYGLVGFSGKDYDMPIAVCSALSLGLGIDFAIHFIQRFCRKYRETGSLKEAHRYIMGDPNRAIARNAVVIILGFLPLTLSTLGPYITVGLFFAMLMAFSALSTLVLLPAIMNIVCVRILGSRDSDLWRIHP
jgi:uncharacterized protein